MFWNLISCWKRVRINSDNPNHMLHQLLPTAAQSVAFQLDHHRHHTHDRQLGYQHIKDM